LIFLSETGFVPIGLYKRLKLRNLKEDVHFYTQMAVMLGA
jgi:hypothetical protein